MRTISMIAIFAYIFFLWILSELAYDRFQQKDLIMFLPLVYFFICFCISFAKYKSLLLFIVGSIANLALIVWAVDMYLAGPTGWVCSVSATPWPLLWGLMYFRLNKVNTHVNQSTHAAKEKLDAGVGGLPKPP